MTQISVIIPLAEGEDKWKNLLADLADMPNGTEILLVYSKESEEYKKDFSLSDKKVSFIKSKRGGRAQQMNAGAKIAKGEFLWFLHADTKFSKNTIDSLLASIEKYPQSLLYFDLSFLNDASPLMFLNQWGVWLRCHVLKVPFGDQAFCIKRKLFEKLNGYKENLNYGEGHVFVWTARAKSIKIQGTGGKIYTSARKYKKNGWLKTTIMHQYLWIKQAWPYIWRLNK